MSTYWHLECESHDPPLRSEDEVSQHTDHHLTEVREMWSQRAEIVAMPDYFEYTGGDPYFGPNALRFIVRHPRCTVRLVSEYGDTEPIELPPAQPGDTP
jgi:hypothetical protein